MERGGVAASALDAARALAASGKPWFWLDGEAAAPGERRVSYLGLASEVREAVGGEERAFLTSLRADLPDDAPVVEGFAADGFGTGWVVALGYEFGVGLLGLEPALDDAAPAVALRADAVLAVDHESGRSELRGTSGGTESLGAVLERSGCVVRDPITAAQAEDSGDVAKRRDATSWRGADYEAQVAHCLEAIQRGDAYVLCLTDTAETSTRATPLELYERLRAGAMRGGVISVPGRALVSASPERFLSVRGSRVATHPIKGTRPRGDTAASDAELAAELAADPKERAENLMIVDLMRNDLTRVCVPESVRVERFLAVESHPRVHQLVSTIAGELSSGRDCFDAIESCFPAGSMTGAPKRSAIEILGSLEAGPRGLYSGCFGWIGDSGNAELAMTIRGVELRGESPQNRAGSRDTPVRALVGAGGGITADSLASSERQERDLKAAAMLANL